MEDNKLTNIRLANFIKSEIEGTLPNSDGRGFKRFFKFDGIDPYSDDASKIIILTSEGSSVHKVSISIEHETDDCLKEDIEQFYASKFSKEEIDLVGSTLANLARVRVDFIDKQNNRVLTFLPCNLQEVFLKYVNFANKEIVNGIIPLSEVPVCKRRAS